MPFCLCAYYGQTDKELEKLSKGRIVPVDIAIVPISRIWHKGQQLQVLVSGHYIREGWFEPLSWELNNKGTHVIHTGGKYDSFLQIPVIPPRYTAGDYVYRWSILWSPLSGKMNFNHSALFEPLVLICFEARREWTILLSFKGFVRTDSVSGLIPLMKIR